MKDNVLGFFVFKICVLLLLSVVSINTAVAQQEVIVMVNGPWAYVADPSPSPSPYPDPKGRLIVIAPQASDHAPAVIFSGGDASSFANHTSVEIGKYQLDISNFDPNLCPTPKPTSSFATYPIDNVNVSTQISPAVAGKKPRYAFSLPAPCFVTAAPKSDRRSKIDPDKDPDDKTYEGPYNIWLALHYYVKQVDSATLSGTSDDKSVTYNTVIKFTKSKNRKDNAISLVMYSNQPDTDLPCDSTSAASIWRSGDLFGYNLHVRMPSVDADGVQGSFDYKCPPNVAAAANLVHNSALVQKQIKELQSLLNSRPVPTKKASDTLNDIRAALDPLVKNAICTKTKNLPCLVNTELVQIETFLKNGNGGKKERTLKPSRSSQTDAETSGSNLSLNSARKYVIGLTAGAGDCRGAQLNINGAIPQH